MAERTPPHSESHERSCCPIACTLDLVGDRWTLLVVRDLFRGVATFSEFRRSPEGIAPNILSSRLAMLVERGFVERVAGPTGKRQIYRLTAKGRSLGPLLRAIVEWGLDNIEGTEARLAPEGWRDA
ncbi:MAG: helix-turn-helix domain-containing protein [Planctomycetota bacterium]